MERGLKLSEKRLKKDWPSTLAFRTLEPEFDSALSLTSFVTLDKFINIFEYHIFFCKMDMLYPTLDLHFWRNGIGIIFPISPTEYN